MTDHCPQVADRYPPDQQPRGPWWPVLLLVAVLVLMAAALPAQSPPFSYVQNITTTPRLGWVANIQLGNQSQVLTNVTWCEQDILAYTPYGTAIDMGFQWGLSPTVGNQIVLATEGYRCQPFPQFQPFFPVGSYVPLMGVSFTNYATSPLIPGAHPLWARMQLEQSSVSFFVPPFRVVLQATMPYERFLATIDVPADPLLVGTVLYYQAYRVDPFTGQTFAGRTMGLWLQ